LKVRSGRPINPLSPSRAGIIQDAAYHELLDFIKAELFKFVFDPNNRTKIKASHVEGCYKLDRAYSIAHSPYFVAESIETTDDPTSFEEFTGTSVHEIFTYDQAPLLLNEQVTLQLPSGTSDCEYGLRSFLRQIGPAYQLGCGDVTRLTIGTLWWRPDGQPKHKSFYSPGEYGISCHDDTPPDNWLAITNSPVFVFTYTNSYDAGEIDFVVGTNADPLDFLQCEAWAGFEAHDDDDNYDSQEDSYRHSLDHLIRTIIGKCVPKDFNLFDISAFLKDRAAPIVEIKYHFKSDGHFVNPRRTYKRKGPGAMTPAEITAKTATGEKIRLKLY
jgi:hypothetical protein